MSKERGIPGKFLHICRVLNAPETNRLKDGQEEIKGFHLRENQAMRWKTNLIRPRKVWSPLRFRACALAGLPILLAATVLAFGPAGKASATEEGKDASSQAATSAAKTLDQLYAELARVRAELVAAQGQVPPDWQKIGQLMAELQRLRAEITSRQQAPGALVGRGVPGGPWCPWGLGPSLGRQWGRGPAAGPRGGGGAKLGPGFGRQGGASPAGSAWGRGMGPRGPGRAFVDQNGNGICDYFEGLRP